VGSKTSPSNDRAAAIDAALKALFDALAATTPSSELQTQIENLEQAPLRAPAAIPVTSPLLANPVDRRAS
jgi:hypothetical protein